MISFYELITIGIIFLSLALLFVFFQFDRIKPGDRIFVYIILLCEIFACIYELLLTNKFDGILLTLHPFYIPVYFVMYPLFYLYFKRLVFTKKELENEKKILIFSAPVLVLIFNLAVYLPFSYEDKLFFLYSDIWTVGNLYSGLYLFKIFVLWLYAIQAVIFLYLFIRLLKAAKGNMSGKIIDKNIVLWLLKWFIVIIIVYELIGIVITLYPKSIQNPVMQTLNFLLLVFLGTLGINHSIMEIQTRFRKVQLAVGDDQKENPQYIISDSEKKEILELISRILAEKKLYKDPNLKIETFSKKIHVSPRKLSIVINDITGNNFSYLLNKYRIEEVKKVLLSDSDLTSIEKIYLHNGFNSRSTFNRVFKTFTGLTPKEYISAKTN